MRGIRTNMIFSALFTLLLVLTGCGSSNAIEVAATAPDFTLSDARGGTVSLSDFSGQAVLLYFHMAVG